LPSPATPAALPAARRYHEIDAARGLMLVLMTLTHVPTMLTDPVGQPFGFVSAAEGFVLLSAFVCGLVYGRIGYAKGVDAMQQAFWRRAVTLYMSQAALLLFLFTVITALALKVHLQSPGARELILYYLAHPREAFAFALALVYQPALLDILPMYILFMLMSPWVMAWAFRHGWRLPLALSALGWLAAQLDATPWLYATVMQGWLKVPVPYAETGSFDTLAWQALWFGGLALGAGRSAPGARPIALPAPWVRTAVAVAAAGLLWRHLGPGGQAPFADHHALNTLLFDKWRLAPLRVLDLVAIGIVALHYGPAWLARLPRMTWLETMGSASLSVFCTHLVAVLLVQALWGGDHHVRPWWGDVLMLAAVFGAMYAVAWAVQRHERRSGKRRGTCPTPRHAPAAGH